MSGPWLRASPLGLPTVIVDLAHLADVPSLDPRTWQRHGGGAGAAAGRASRSTSSTKTTRCALAMRRLATHPALRESLGRAAAGLLARGNTLPSIMVERLPRADGRGAGQAGPSVSLPAHLVDDGDRLLEAILARSSGCDRLRGKA